MSETGAEGESGGQDAGTECDQENQKPNKAKAKTTSSPVCPLGVTAVYCQRCQYWLNQEFKQGDNHKCPRTKRQDSYLQKQIAASASSTTHLQTQIAASASLPQEGSWVLAGSEHGCWGTTVTQRRGCFERRCGSMFENASKNYLELWPSASTTVFSLRHKVIASSSS